MNTTFKKAMTGVLVSGVIAMVGCSSDDSGGGGAAPANAVTFTTDNAVPTVTSAMGTLALLPKGTVEESNLSAAMEVARKNRRNTGVDFAYGASGSWNEIWDCSTFMQISTAGPNTWSTSGSWTDNTAGGSETGTDIFNTCDFLTDGSMIVDGTLTYSDTWTNPSGPWTSTGSGSLEMAFSGETISLIGMNYSESGNDSTGDFTITAFNFTFDTSLGGGFGVAVTTPISGNWGNACPDSGVVTFTGAAGTTAVVTYNQPAGMMTVTVGGVEAVGSPLACLSL